MTRWEELLGSGANWQPANAVPAILNNHNCTFLQRRLSTWQNPAESLDHER